MSTERQTEQIPQWKREEIDALVEMIRSYDSVGVVDLTGIPSRQLQDMRRELHGTAELRVSRNTLLLRAVDHADTDVAELADLVDGHVGLIGTDDNPFGLYQQLEASKTSAPISAGEVAPNDIVIEQGDTGMDPGPFVGELQTVGASARIQDGSIRVTEDSLVCEAGEAVDRDLANVLSELGIEPKEVGLDLRGVISDGVRFEPSELAIDTAAYRSDIAAAATAGRNLSLNAAVPTPQTAGSLLATADSYARNLGVSAGIVEPGVIADVLATADGQVRALAGAIDDDEALPEELQDLGADSEAPTEDEQPTDDDSAEDPTAADETEEETDDDDDDDDAAAEGLGDLFG